MKTNTHIFKSIVAIVTKKVSKSHTVKSGFSLMEVVVVTALLALILGVSIKTFSSIIAKQRVEKDTEEAYSLINRARNLTITGSENSEYGVYFATTTIVMFKGKTYNAGAQNNEVYVFRNNSTVSLISLTGGVNYLYFAKVSGRPSATGTLEVMSANQSTLKEVITIYASGLSEIQ